MLSGLLIDAGQLARHGVEHGHRGDLAAGEHVGADGDAVGDEVGDALVDALVAAAEEDEVAAGELGGQRVVELPPLGRELDDAAAVLDALGVDAEHGLERGADDVDAQHHAGAAAVRRVVHLQVAQRRVVAVVA